MKVERRKSERRLSKRRIVAAFAAVYVIWGSTYLAIRIAIETLPPFLMAGARFAFAGMLLYTWTRLHGAKRPERKHWITAGIVGALLLMGGNGAVVWAEQIVASGIAALLVAVVPCWMVLIDWMRSKGRKPTRSVVMGLVLGLAGIALLVGPSTLAGAARVDPTGAAVLMVGSFCWATGSIYSRYGSVPEVPLMATGMQMCVGGGCLLAAAAITGEFAEFEFEAVSARSLFALLYLLVFGSIIGYTAYVWLLRVSTPARVSTYAYVNPIVAVALGSVFGKEPLTGRMLIAAAVIVAGVALITASPEAHDPARPPTRVQ